VLGINDFALKKGLACATVLIDAETGRRVDVLVGRTADVGAHGEAVCSALLAAVQVSNR
jgi:hypothetical protein